MVDGRCADLEAIVYDHMETSLKVITEADGY